MPRCLLALGANLGSREVTLQNALRGLAELPHTRLLARSSWHEFPAVGGPSGQQSFLNGAVLVDTSLATQELADRLVAIEVRHGRERKIRWASRTLDIDLLLYGGVTIDTPQLTIPHPRMTFRRFVLAPAAEIAGELVVSTSGWTIASLLNHLRRAANYVAVTAADPQLADWLANRLCQRLNAPRLESFFPIILEEDDSKLLSEVEWQKHEALFKRMLPTEREAKLTSAPVIGSFWQPAENSRHSTDLIQPALVIAVDPPSVESFGIQVANQIRNNKAGVEAFHEILRRPSLGPLARITATTSEVALEEALAAISAAWPV